MGFPISAKPTAYIPESLKLETRDPNVDKSDLQPEFVHAKPRKEALDQVLHVRWGALNGVPFQLRGG